MRSPSWFARSFGLAFSVVTPLAFALPARAEPPPCRVTAPAKADLSTLPDRMLAATVVPGLDARGVAPRDHGNAIANCRGQRTTSFWPDDAPARVPGTVIVGARQKLRDGRLAVWLVTDRVMAKPATYRNGFLAIVRLAGDELIADAVGVWGKDEDVPLVLDETLFGPGTWVEPFGHDRARPNIDAEQQNIWVVDDSGRLKSAGVLTTAAREEDTKAIGPHWRLDLTTTVANVSANKVKIIDHLTWKLVGGAQLEVHRSTQTHVYTIEQGALREENPQPRVPPRELPATSAPTPTPPPASARQTLRVPIVAGELELAYDASKITPAELAAAVELSPWGLPDSHAPYSIERCLPQDSRYADCGSRDIDAPAYLTNGEVNMRMNEAALDQARTRKVHPAMAPAREWQVQAMSYYVALEEHRLAFLRTHDPTILRRPIEGVDPMKVCGDIVKQVVDLPYGPAQSRALRVDWQGCMHNATGERFTAVPKEPWLQLLKTTGTTETLHRTNED